MRPMAADRVHKKAMNWEPILSGSLGEQAAESIDQIAKALENPPPFRSPRRYHSHSDRQSDLAQGKAGFAVFYSYAAEALGSPDYQKLASAHLSEAAESLAEIPMAPHLYDGFTGIAWAAEHLRSRGLGDGYPGDPNEEIDEVLQDYLRRPWQGHFDLITGLVGLGVYALERLPRPGAQECLRLILQHLRAAASPRPEGLAWLNGPELLGRDQREKYPRGNYNLGVAHGSPGIVAFMASLLDVSFGEPEIGAQLAESVRWLLAQQQPAGAGFNFPTAVAEDAPTVPSRLTWCHGDPGVAAALFQAARAADRGDWEQVAMEVMLQAVARPEEKAGISDAELCHGAAGLAHIYNRFYQATGVESLRDAAVLWFDRALKMRTPGQGFAGYSCVQVDDDDKKVLAADPGILMGAAGIGLALLAATTTCPPDWDRVMLLSIPPRSA